MIARIWRGVTEDKKSEAYVEYLKKTGMSEIRSIPGNQAAWILRRVANGKAEFLFISLWDSMESIRKFAGPDAEVAHYYDEDRDFLLEMVPNVDHFEVVGYESNPA